MKKLLVSAFLCGFMVASASAQTAPDQQEGQQSDPQQQNPRQTEAQQSGQGSTQPAPTTPAAVVPAPAPLRPGPVRSVSVRPVAPSSVGKIPVPTSRPALPTAINERSRAALHSAGQPQSAAVVPRVVMYGNLAPKPGMIAITAPAIEKADSIRLVPDRKGVCGWTTSVGGSGTVGTSSAPNSDAECRRNWYGYVERISKISWTDEGPSTAGGYLPDPPRDIDRVAVEGPYERFRAQPHSLVMQSGVRTSTLNLGSMTLSNPNPDMDGDGHRAFAFDGDDCDDGDPNRFIGNTEVADFEGLDEDCDPSTIGIMDKDGDGFTDFRVFNAVAPNSAVPAVRGDDCDDTRRGVNPSAPEVPGNGLDDNCDGDVDFDRSWPTRPS